LAQGLLVAGVAVPEEAAGELRPEAIQRTDPRVLKPGMNVLGFDAAGNEGNMSSVRRGGGWFLLGVEPRRVDAVVLAGRETWPRVVLAS